MNIQAVLKNNTFCYSENKHNVPLYDQLIDLQELKELLIASGDKALKSDDIYNQELFQGVEIYRILFEREYQYQLPISVEEVKMLNKIIEQSSTINEDNYNQILEDVKSNNLTKPYGLLCCYLFKDEHLHINSFETLIKVRRHFLNLIGNIKDFVEACALCFPNLYFHPKIEKSIATLSAPFNVYKNEVIRHLSVINDIFHPLYKEARNEGLISILKTVESEGSIKCTLEGNAASAKQRLEFNFLNSLGVDEKLICEPHTKLEGTNAPGDTKYRYDRIYFHEGRENIADGKTLIAHIGDHL